jgi:hypothetical protein
MNFSHVTQQQTVEYISEMLLSMRGLAAKHDLNTLEMLLTLAHREADLRAHDES